MTDAWGSLHIDVVDDEIIVSLPATSYSVVYYSGRPVLFVTSPSKARRALAARAQAGAGSASASPSSVLLLGSDPELLEFGIGPGDASLLARSDAHQLVRLLLQRLQELARR